MAEMEEEKLSKDAFQKELQLLLQLQDLDVKMRDLLYDKSEHPARLAQLKEEFKGKGGALEEAKEGLKAVQAEIKTKELEIQSNQEKMDKYANQLLGIKNNEEYQALNKEIAHLKEINSGIEDGILEEMIKVDEAKKNVSQRETELGEEEKKLKQKEQEVEQRLKNIEDEIAQVAQSQETLRRQINEEFLSVYDRVFANKDDVAIVAVESHTCQGCRMELTHQDTNDVKRGNSIVRCENCSRILYLAE